MLNSKSTKLGIFSWFGFDLPLPERLRLIKEAGFTHTSLWWGNDGDEYVPVNKHESVETARATGLEIDNFHVPFLRCCDLWSNNESLRKALVEDHFRWIEDCAHHRIPTMVFHITRGWQPVDSIPAGLDSIAAIIGKAEECGIKLAVENTRQIDKLELIFNEFQSDFFKICFDTSHFWLYSRENPEPFFKLGKHIITTHISDNDETEDRHWIPGLGKTDWNLITKILRNGRYNGLIHLELLRQLPGDNDSPEVFLERAYKKGLELLQSPENHQ
ncbi:MAG: sugar phosphate isomerase/epimerase [Firmicutes bacterium]|nr:sugar phosphate isomerase/epimerase [Bacillota bacterium]